MFRIAVCVFTLLVWTDGFGIAGDIRVGASAVNLKCDEKMVIAGSLEAHYTKEQEGELRVVAHVIEKPGSKPVAVVACDVLWVPRDLADLAVAEIERTIGIPASHILINATHTHHAPSPAPAHAFGVSQEFREILHKAIVQAVEEAHQKLPDGEADFFFHLGEENTIGANSRLLLDDGNITWLNPRLEEKKSGKEAKPTGPFDPQLPVLEFRGTDGKSRGLIYNHSTHTIGTRAGRDVRSPGFYGLAAQELESEIGAIVSFLEGASGSTHNIDFIPVDQAILRMKAAINEARSRAERRSVDRIAGLRRPLKFRVRQFDDAEEDAKIERYTTKYASGSSNRIRDVFANMRAMLRPQQGQERETWVQAVVIGDVAIVGVPAEYFTALGVDIKKRSPFKHTYVAELANDWVGYLPDREGHRLGGYQTWMGLHCYAEIGTGERIADEAVAILNELAGEVATSQTDSSPSLRGPLTPDAERESFQLADSELTIELVAAEPDIVSPVAIAWDPDGKLYVAEMIGYPNKEGLCRVAVLQDPDGDGHYQRTSTFADNLSFVTSVLPYRDGLLVTSAPDLLFLKDTDADGIADVRKVEFTGFGTGSQQLRANSLHFGIDNWIYGANGRCDGEIIRPGQSAAAAVSLRTRDFRFDATMNDFQSILGQSQFGQVHNDWGERFLSWNVIPVRHVLIEDRYLANAPHKIAEAVVDIADPADTKQVFPISPPPRQFNSEQANYYNAMCGLSIYRGDRLGSAYEGNAFVGESLSNLVTRRVLEPNGPTFTARRVEEGKEFLASRDSWFHPVNTANGPDGSLYVVDFYREFVEHPIYVANLKARAETNWREGAEHGRLWRIRRNDIPRAARRPKLSSADNAELVRTLEHPVGWWRDTAQRLLFDRNQQHLVPELSVLLNSSRNPVARLHALWTHSNLSFLATNDLIAMMKDENPLLRRHAILRAELKPQSDSREVRTTLLAMADDPDSRVRFQVGLTLGLFIDRIDSHDVTDAFVKLIGDGEDRWMVLAVSCGAAQVAIPVLDRLLARPEWLNTPSAARTRFLEETAAQIRAEENGLPAVMTREQSQVAKRLAPGEISILAGITKRAVANGLTPAAQLLPLIQTAIEAAVDENLPLATRIQAVEILARHQPANAVQVLIQLLQPAQPVAMQIAAARATADLRDQQQLAAIYSEWNLLGTQARLEILQNSSRSATATAAVLNAVEQDLVKVREIPPATAVALTQVRDAALKDRVHRLLASVLTSNRGSIIEKYSSIVTMRGDVRRGAQHFKQQCLVCHSIQGFGNRVGPDLSGVGGRRNDMLLIDILDPSRVVAPDFISYVAATRQGQVVTGLIAAESPVSLTFKRADGKSETIERANIDELRSTGKSLMPDGLEEKLSPLQLVDVLEFLRKPDRELLK